MLWSYVQLDDGTQLAYSEIREDGAVRVAVERPVDFAFDRRQSAFCLRSNGLMSKASLRTIWIS